MASVLETSYFRQLENSYIRNRNTSSFGQCDCTSYSYFLLSFVLFVIGVFVTILALGRITNDYVFASLGQMWLVGPIFICASLMIAVKSILYLRKKYLIQMFLRQRAMIRELAQQSRRQTSYVTRNSSTITLPPPYETLVHDLQTIAGGGPVAGTSSNRNDDEEAPPPTYEEAMFLFQELKLHEFKLMREADKEVAACVSYQQESPSKP